MVQRSKRNREAEMGAMSGKDSLSREERAYFDSKGNDHDLLMRHDAILFAPATGLDTTVLRNNVTLYGDGTKEHPGIVNVLYEHIRNQDQNEKKRYRNLQLTVAVVGILILLVDRILPLLGIK